MAILARMLEARRATCAPLAGKSTLNRLEHASWKLDRYHKIGHDDAAIERLFVDLFLNAHRQPPARIVIDLMPPTIPCTVIKRAFFHGYYDCFCYLPLYVFCGRHLLAAKLGARHRPPAGALYEIARITAQIRAPAMVS